jgi:poly(hydroxyalkanoate) depolymerase family esterase
MPMTLNNKFFAQMRAATRSMMRRGPSVARSVMRESIKSATAMQAAGMNAARGTLEHASNQAQFGPSDMLADLSRIGLAEGNPFNAPPLSTGAASIGLPGHFVDGSYTNDAGTRNYKLYVPSTYSGQPAPLLVMLHGCSQHPDDFALGTGMNVVAEEYGCLVVYPAQSGQANASRCWNWYNAVEQQRGQGEPAIIAGLTQDIMARHVIDPSQVYVAGLSAGGAMAAILGTLYPELYAAVGVHSGLPFAAAHDLGSAIAAMQGELARSRSSCSTATATPPCTRSMATNWWRAAAVIRTRRPRSSRAACPTATPTPAPCTGTRTAASTPNTGSCTAPAMPGSAGTRPAATPTARARTPAAR